MKIEFTLLLFAVPRDWAHLVEGELSELRPTIKKQKARLTKGLIFKNTLSECEQGSTTAERYTHVRF